MKPIEQLKLNIALLEAAHREDGAEDIRRLLAARADWDTRDYWGDNALHMAAGKGLVDNARVLVEHGFPIDCRNDRGNTTLHIAASSHRLECLRFLITVGADVNAVNDRGETPAQRAVTCGLGTVEKRACIRLLMDAGSTIQTDTEETLRCMGYAVRDQDVEMVKLLLAGGVSPHGKNRWGEPFTHVAAQHDDKTCLQLLLGAEGKALREVKNREADMFAAAANDNPDKLRLIIERGADVHTRDAEGRTPLHCAAAKGLLNNACILLKAGADVNARSVKGYTPLLEAACNHRYHMVYLLLKVGAQANTRAKNGTSVWLQLCGANYSETRNEVRMLAETGARPSTRREHRALMKYLLDGGGILCPWNIERLFSFLEWGDADTRDESGNTVLLQLLKMCQKNQLYAYSRTDPFRKPERIRYEEYMQRLHDEPDRGHGHIMAAVLYMLEQGADINATNAEEESVMDLAELYAEADVAHTLRIAGAKYSFELGEDTPSKQFLRSALCSITPISLPEPEEWHTVEDVLKYARVCTEICGLEDWQWKVKKSDGSWLGLCSYAESTMYLCPECLNKGHLEIKITILHELGHALAGRGHGHNIIWKKCCAALGAPGMFRWSRHTHLPQKVGLENIPEPKEYKKSPPSPITHVLCHRETGEVFRSYKACPKYTTKRLAKMSIRGREEETRGKLCVSVIPAERGERTLFAECSEDGKTIYDTSEEIPRMTERRLRDTHAQGRRLCYLLTLENMVDYECA